MSFVPATFPTDTFREPEFLPGTGQQRRAKSENELSPE
ncbi:hypothetical protein RCH23_000665 [Cryobacterium sp. CAN_C3]|nr:hypothetical protein [Cryobacterium sp. CAN_C3]